MAKTNINTNLSTEAFIDSYIDKGFVIDKRLSLKQQLIDLEEQLKSDYQLNIVENQSLEC